MHEEDQGRDLVARSLLRLLRYNVETQFLGASDDHERRFVPDAILRQKLMKIIDAGSRMIVKANNYVSFAHPTFSCRAVTLERYDQDSAFNGKVIVAHDTTRKRNVLSR